MSCFVLFFYCRIRDNERSTTTTMTVQADTHDTSVHQLDTPQIDNEWRKYEKRQKNETCSVVVVVGCPTSCY